MDNSLQENPDAATVIPFAGLDPEQIRQEVDRFMEITGLHIWKEHFIKGAFLAQDPEAFQTTRDDNIELLPKEKEDLGIEKTRKWRQAWPMWILVGFLALGAAIQGFDETAVNSGK